MTPEHKAKLIAARDASVEARRKLKLGLSGKENMTTETMPDPREAEIAELKRQLEAAKRPKEDVSMGQPVHMQPIKGHAEELRTTMQDYVAEQVKAQMQTLFPERSEPIRSRETARDPRPVVRRNAMSAFDRDGNPIHRRRNSLSDPFAIPSDLKEPGWDHQWVRVSVHGWEDVDNQVGMQENGWRPISANRPGWEGRFMPPGYTGAIQKSGLMLMERPMSLTEEARSEEKRIVRDQTEVQRKQFGMALPRGFEANAPARAATGIRVGPREATPTELRPNLAVREAMEIDG
jgi:hypothetical protein